MTRRFHDSIAIIDLDGPGMIIDPSLRDQEAQRRVRVKTESMEKPPAPDSNDYKSLFYSKDAFYDPSLLVLDRLNPSADLAIARLQELYEDVYILTSRPNFLAEPTESWLDEHGLYIPHQSIRYKLYALGEDKREQYVATALWKSIITHQASYWYKHVLFVDNEKRNREAVQARNLANVTIEDSLAPYCFDDSPIIA